MTAPEAVAALSQTLAERMAQGRIPVPLALRYSMILAEALRKIHASGQAHGAVSPACIAITQTGLDLLPASGSMGCVTPYTAPEAVQGKPADSRSDIFSLGAILYELLTGRAAFQGDSAEALAAAILNSAPAPSGSPAVDRLVAGCIAKDPAARWPRVQRLLLELKLLGVAVRRSESAPVHQQADAALRAALAEVESRLTGRLERFEQSLEEVKERLARIELLLQTTVDRAGLLEHAVDSALEDTATLRENVSGDLGLLDRSLKSQAATIESVRTAAAQTDDLVEHVVEALESLQSVVLDHSDDRGEDLH
jgi:methyl-accepting chemotaxis protein